MNNQNANLNLPFKVDHSDLIRYGTTGLYVLPSRHHSPEFAAMALRSGLWSFDRICLELDSGHSVSDIQDAIHAIYPGSGGVLTHDGTFSRMKTPGIIGAVRPRVRKVYQSAFLPIVADSMITTLRYADAANADGSQRIYFIDQYPPYPEYKGGPPDVAVPNAQEFEERGLRETMERWWPIFTSMRTDPLTDYRDVMMASRLQSLVLEPGLTGLFICGAAHWPKIKELLDKGVPEQPEEVYRTQPPKQCRRIMIAPEDMYLSGRMDIPVLAKEYFLRQRKPYCRGKLLQRWLISCARRYDAKTSMHTLLNLFSSIQLRCLRDGKWEADLMDHILPAAEVTLGREFGNQLVNEAFAARNPPVADIDHGHITYHEKWGTVIYVGTEMHVVQEPIDESKRHRRKTALRKEWYADSDVGTGDGTLMKVPEEEQLHRFMCETARKFALDEEVKPKREIRPFTRSLCGGIAVKRTIRSAACGENKLFVYRKRPRRKIAASLVNMPVVWVFDRARAIRPPVSDFFSRYRNGKGLVTTSFWFYDRKTVGSIRRSRIACLVRLFKNVTPSWDKELVRKNLFDTLPADMPLPKSPGFDIELRNFNGPNLAISWAAKWGLTDRIAVVNCDPAYTPASRVQQYAARKGKNLVMVSPGRFPSACLERYQWDHEATTEGSWCAPKNYAQKDILHVPEANVENL